MLCASDAQIYKVPSTGIPGAIHYKEAKFNLLEAIKVVVTQY